MRHHRNNIVKAGGFTQGLNKKYYLEKDGQKIVGLTIDMNNMLQNIDAANGKNNSPYGRIRTTDQTVRGQASPHKEVNNTVG